MRSFIFHIAGQYLGDQISEDKRSRACGTYGGIMDAYVVLLGKRREKDNFEDTDFIRRILKLIS
jgi:hypothetical protein